MQKAAASYKTLYLRKGQDDKVSRALPSQTLAEG